MYELVFTNFRTHMDIVGKADDRTLVPTIMDMIKDGKWALTELRHVEESNGKE